MSRFGIAITLLVLVGSNSCGVVRESVEEFGYSAACGDQNFRHKSQSEIAAMTPEEKMAQMVLEQMYHVPSSNDDNYNQLHDGLVDDGVKILPTVIQYAKNYDPTTKECPERNNAQLLTAGIYIHIVDSGKFRVRAIEEGRVAISALEQALERRRGIASEGVKESRTRLLAHFLTEVKGLCIKDHLIRKELAIRYEQNMSDAELVSFTQFLIELDPAYPAWTKVVGSAEMAPEEVDRYYQAFLKFKKQRKA